MPDIFLLRESTGSKCFPPTKKNQFSKTCKRVNLQQYFLRCGVDILSKKGDLAMLWKIHLFAYLVMLKKMLKIIKVSDCVMGV